MLPSDRRTNRSENNFQVADDTLKISLFNSRPRASQYGDRPLCSGLQSRGPDRQRCRRADFRTIATPGLCSI